MSTWPQPFSPKTSVHGPKLAPATDLPLSKRPIFSTYLTSLNSITAGAATAPTEAPTSPSLFSAVMSLIAIAFNQLVLRHTPDRVYRQTSPKTCPSLHASFPQSPSYSPTAHSDGLIGLRLIVGLS